MLNTKKTTNKLFGIRNRIFIGFIAISIIILISIGFIINKINRSEQFSEKVTTIELPLYDAVIDLNRTYYTSVLALLRYIVLHHENDKKIWQHGIEVMDTRMQAIDALIDKSHYDSKWTQLKKTIQSFKTESTLLANSPNPTPAAYEKNIIPINQLVFQLIEGVESETKDRKGGLLDQQLTILHNGTDEVLKNFSDIKKIEYILLVMCLIFSALIAYLTAKSIIKPLKSAITIAKNIAAGERNASVIITSNDETAELLEALSTMQNAIKENEEKLKHSENKTRELFQNIVNTADLFSAHISGVAAGDLTNRIDDKGASEMGQLGKDLNTMTDSLATITKQITESCHNMVSTIEEVKRSIDVQSTGATEQASSINEITSSLEEIEKSSTQTIEKAKTLGEVAKRTREKGQIGLEAVEQSISGMKSVRDKVEAIAKTILDLSNQTQQVGDITAVVNTLAQQSKMLALNASIEAAKAGEAGKGFSVVAAEVKNLAEQSEQSTTQVQKILEDIRHATEKAVIATEEGTKGVDHGTLLVEQTGEVVRSLSDVIHETSIASQQIEAAIRQEGIGIEQITAGMNEINQVTASFVESVTQTTEAIDNLGEIAKKLKNYVDIYKI